MSDQKKYISQIKHLRAKYVRFSIDFRPEVLNAFKEKCALNKTTPTAEIKKFVAEYLKDK